MELSLTDFAGFQTIIEVGDSEFPTQLSLLGLKQKVVDSCGLQDCEDFELTLCPTEGDAASTLERDEDTHGLISGDRLFVVPSRKAAAKAVLQQHGIPCTTASLHNAVSKREATVSSILLQAGVPVDSRNAKGETALMIASRQADLPLCKTLIENTADVNAVNCYGATPLQWAVQYNAVSVVHLLLDCGANAEQASAEGVTPLMLACENAVDPLIVDALFQKDVSVNARSHQGVTALMFAASKDSVAVVASLLSEGADLEMTDAEGWSALLHASETGAVAVTDLLLAKGSQVNQVDDDGWTSLMLASQNGHADCVALLLACGADMTLKETSGQCCLLLAQAEQREAVVQVLIQHIAQTSAKFAEAIRLQEEMLRSAGIVA